MWNIETMNGTWVEKKPSIWMQKNHIKATSYVRNTNGSFKRLHDTEGSIIKFRCAMTNNINIYYYFLASMQNVTWIMGIFAFDTKNMFPQIGKINENHLKHVRYTYQVELFAYLLLLLFFFNVRISKVIPSVSVPFHRRSWSVRLYLCSFNWQFESIWK